MFKHSFCGGKHNTVAEARTCEQSGTRPSLSPQAREFRQAGRALVAARPRPSVTTHVAHVALRPAWRTDSTNWATDRQVNFLRDLAEKRQTERASAPTVETCVRAMTGMRITFDQARAAITEAKTMPYRTRPATTTVPAATAPQAGGGNLKAKVADLKAKVPNGRYAVRGTVKDAEDNKLRFFFVRERNGYLRIDQCISDDRRPVEYGPRYLRILQAIVDAGVAEAALAYADNMGECSRCGRELTDENNPYKPFGFGPDCGPKVAGFFGLA